MMNVSEILLSNSETVCRTCLESINAEDGTPISKCKAAMSSPERMAMLNQVFKAVSLELFDDPYTSQSIICGSCNDQMLSIVLFLDTCQQSDLFLKQHIIKTEVNPEEETRYQGDEDFIFYPSDKICDVSIPSVEEVSESDDLPFKLKSQRKSRTNNYNECSKTFKSAKWLKNHLKRSTTLIHRCSLCLNTFSSSRLLESHYVTDHADEDDDVLLEKIEKVDAEFTHALKFGVKSVSDNEQKSYICDICMEEFSSKLLLKRHMKRHSKRFVCFCGQAYNRRSKLLHHDVVIHKKQKLFKCLKCEKSFTTKGSLKNHETLHLDSKSYLCSACPLAYHSPMGLQQHWRRIHDIKRVSPAPSFLCASCGKSFGRQYHLDRHTTRHHTPEAPLNYICVECGKGFPFRDGLRFHMRTHSEERPYHCKECDRTFKAPSSLYTHKKRVHLGVRPFGPCSTCGAAFKCKAHLEKHIRTHTGEKPFPCPQCPYTCAERSNLKKHIKIHERSR